MTSQKPIAFLAGPTGAYWLLIILLITSTAGAQSITMNDFERLGKRYYQSGNYYMAYHYSLSYYHLSADSAPRLHAASRAFKASIYARQNKETRRLARIFSSDYPFLQAPLASGYLYSLSRQDLYTQALEYAAILSDEAAQGNRYHFLQAYNLLQTNRSGAARQQLGQVSPDFPYSGALQRIRQRLQAPPETSKKSLAVALPLSIVLPGAGQVYNGFWYDAAQDFVLNMVACVGANASWKYTLSQPKTALRYCLTDLSSL